jgi:hypothetical protein
MKYETDEERGGLTLDDALPCVFGHAYLTVHFYRFLCITILLLTVSETHAAFMLNYLSSLATCL